MGDRYLYKSLSTAEGGINSLLSPQLLPDNTLAWSVNATVRGGYIQTRPPLFKQAISYPSTEIQTAVEQGYFQGAGYYRPDYGTQQVIAQVSGRLFAFTPSSGYNWSCVEITIAGDPNSATAVQVWMNQAERWLIITDGTSKLPIFYDGTSCRRSYGPSVLLGQVSAISPANPPLSGGAPDPDVIITATLVSPYTGPFDIPVLFNGEIYQVRSSSTTSESVVLTKLPRSSAATYPTGTDISVNPGRIGYVISNSGPAGGVGFHSIVAVMSSITGLALGNKVSITNVTRSAGGSGLFTVTFLDAATNRAQFTDTVSFAGTLSFLDFFSEVQLVTPTPGPVVILATTTSPFTAPAVGASVTAQTNQPFLGTAGTVVWVGDDQYTIAAPSAPVVSTTLYMTNLTDTSTAAYSGFPLDILSVPELPAGRMGAYGLGHQTMCLTDGISFIYGDTVGGPSGTQAQNYRDAVLKTTENDFLDSRGSFKLPTSGEPITSMTFTAILDAAYGQGPLQIGTQSTIFTCAVPADPADWATMTNPIVTETLIGKGPLAQNSTLLANSDTVFRSTVGLGSLVYARREFITNWGNTPISSEVFRATVRDDVSLLNVASAVTFDNRLLHTNKPTAGPRGVYHQGSLAMNFDPVSSLKEKSASVWESLWTGLNTLQYVQGNFSNSDRCLLFSYDEVSGALQFWEQLRGDTTEYADNGDSPIEWAFETACIFKPEERDKNIPIVRLWNGRMHVANVTGEVHIKVMYRPDFWPCWITWHETDLCANVNAANSNSHPAYFDPIGFGEPSVANCEAGNNRPMRSGRFFQVRVEITGKCTVMGMDFAAVPEPSIAFPAPKCEVEPCQDVICTPPDDYAYNMNGPASDSDVTVYGNQQKTYRLCSPDATVVPIPSVVTPGWITYNATGDVVFGPNIFYATTQAAADALAEAALESFVTNSLVVPRAYDCIRP